MNRSVCCFLGATIALGAACRRHHGPELAFELDRSSPECRADVSDEVALRHARRVVSDYLRATAQPDVEIEQLDHALRFEFPDDAPADRVGDVRRRALASVRLELAVIDDRAPQVLAIASQLANDPDAVAAGIQPALDGAALTAMDRDRTSGRMLLRDYLGKVTERRPELATPAFRRFVFEPAPGMPHAWRTYLVELPARLTGESIAKITPSYDLPSDRPIATIEVTVEAARELDALTTQNVGRGLAVVLDLESVKWSGVIARPLHDGRITLGANAGSGTELMIERDELVAAVEAAAVPCPLREAR